MVETLFDAESDDEHRRSRGPEPLNRRFSWRSGDESPNTITPDELAAILHQGNEEIDADTPRYSLDDLIPDEEIGPEHSVDRMRKRKPLPPAAHDDSQEQQQSENMSTLHKSMAVALLDGEGSSMEMVEQLEQQRADARAQLQLEDDDDEANRRNVMGDRYKQGLPKMKASYVEHLRAENPNISDAEIEARWKAYSKHLQHHFQTSDSMWDQARKTESLSLMPDSGLEEKLAARRGRPKGLKDKPVAASPGKVTKGKK